MGFWNSLFGNNTSNAPASPSYGRGLPPNKTHGPVVQTGPTAGQNRARNEDGRWRKKRSDAK